jgi:flagellar hook-basal body complex protein FliE
MTVVPLLPPARGAAPESPAPDAAPDVPLGGTIPALGVPPSPSDGDTFAGALADALGAAAGALGRADAAERAFAAHRGGLQEMVLERARADVMLSLASSAASRAAQALSTILGMQV